MAQQLRTLIALPEDWGSIPSTHMAAHNHLTPSGFRGGTVCTDIHANRTLIYKVNESFKKQTGAIT